MARLVQLALLLAVAAAPAAAQTPQPVPAAAGTANALSTTLKQLYDGVTRNVVEAAEKMPADQFAFKPTPEVRSFGEMVGHVADSFYSYCSRANQATSPSAESVEKTKTTKADLVTALKAAQAYCDGVYGAMTDAKAMTLVKAGQNEVPAVRLLIQNVSHTNEHYGNLVTYMRLKSLVPPSTERAQQMRRPGE
jgi:uncharacterized damage-inducible protein DinB